MKKQTPAEPEPIVAPRTDGSGDKTFAIRLWGEGDTRSEYVHEEPRAREVIVGGMPFEHDRTDPDGVWVYRNARKN